MGPMGTIRKCSRQYKKISKSVKNSRQGDSSAKVAPYIQALHIECIFRVNTVEGDRLRMATPRTAIWQGLNMNNPFPVATFMQAVNRKDSAASTPTRISRMLGLVAFLVEGGSPRSRWLYLIARGRQTMMPMIDETMGMILGTQWQHSGPPSSMKPASITPLIILVQNSECWPILQRHNLIVGCNYVTSAHAANRLILVMDAPICYKRFNAGLQKCAPMFRHLRTCAPRQKYQVVMLRHGESIWNKEKRFTGWTDVKLSETGVLEAIRSGQILREKGFKFDICFTSVLTRAIQTFNYAADELDCHHIPVIKSWRLNERHYGALEGLSKVESAEIHGKKQKWKRSFNIAPPALEENDSRHPKFDARYKHLEPHQVPTSESLLSTLQRVMPFWENNIVPALKENKKVLIVTHGNAMRGLIKQLSKIPQEQATELIIPTAIPLVYQFDEGLRVLGSKYVAEAEQLESRVKKAGKQTKIA